MQRHERGWATRLHVERQRRAEQRARAEEAATSILNRIIIKVGSLALPPPHLRLLASRLLVTRPRSYMLQSQPLVLLRERRGGGERGRNADKLTKFPLVRPALPCPALPAPWRSSTATKRARLPPCCAALGMPPRAACLRCGPRARWRLPSATSTPSSMPTVRARPPRHAAGVSRLARCLLTARSRAAGWRGVAWR